PGSRTRPASPASAPHGAGPATRPGHGRSHGKPLVIGMSRDGRAPGAQGGPNARELARRAR
ncbi:hypothetical protein ACFQ7X_29145, partial [Streptomyces sp. NPDC056525]